MRKAFLAAAVVVAAAVVGATAFAARGTVNSYTTAQEDRAKAKVVNAGYRPDKLAMVQDGNFFFTATKNGEQYQVTVTSSGKVYAGAGMPSENADKPPAG